MQLACPNCMAKNRVPDERLREARPTANAALC